MPQLKFANAVKAFIINDGKLLLIQRPKNVPHAPGIWDIPGGRLEPAENPRLGLKREAKEETNLEIEIIIPLDIHHFIRDDNQKITMIIFLCRPINNNLKLSHEHIKYKWLDIREPINEFPKWLHPVINNYLTYIK